MTSRYQDILTQVKTQIAALSLSNIEADEIQIRKFPWTRDHVYSGITIHPGAEFEERGNNTHDDIVYPVMITMIQGTIGITDDIDRIATWRQTIRKEFIHQRLDTLTCINTVRIKWGEVFLPKKFRDNYDASTMALLVSSREDRVNA